MNAHQTIYVVSPEYLAGGQIMFRDNLTPMIAGKHVLVLAASVTTGKTAQAAIDADKFSLCITPEGTRSVTKEWKRGFYYIAQKAQIPILLYGVDYEKKLIKCTKSLVPNGDIDKEMKSVMAYYKDFKGRHPERFAIEE